MPLSVLWVDSSLTFCIVCFVKVFFTSGFFFFFSSFFPSPAGPVGPPSREPNEQNTCLNSYKIFILCRAAGGMLCLFWCRAKFPTRTICLQSGPSLSLSGSQGKWARNVATPFFQLQASIAGHFCDTTALKTALHFQSSKPKLPGDFQLRHWYPLSPTAPSRHIYIYICIYMTSRQLQKWLNSLLSWKHILESYQRKNHVEEPEALA